MYPENYLLYLEIILFLFITPGSPRVLIVSYSMTYGVKKSAWMAFGDITANSIQMIVVTFIIGSVLLAYPQIMIIMKWLGVIYLTYLAYELFRSKVKNFSSSNEKIAKTNISFFRDGFLVAGLSPKALIFFGAISARILGSSCMRLQRLRKAIATARLAASWPIMWLSSWLTISAGVS